MGRCQKRGVVGRCQERGVVGRVSQERGVMGRCQERGVGVYQKCWWKGNSKEKLNKAGPGTPVIPSPQVSGQPECHDEITSTKKKGACVYVEKCIHCKGLDDSSVTFHKLDHSRS